jgi:phosphoserine aminotransferase
MKHNFSAGPCILPREVIERAASAVLDFNESGLSLIEISHRSKDFVAVMDKAQSLALKLLGLENKGYKALFLQGGASLQFAMVPMNLFQRSAAYLDTGTWSTKAIEEAKRMGTTHVMATSADQGYRYIPEGFDLPQGVDYVHYTSNNTIYGTQMARFPKTDAPLVCDMSSDIFSRQLDFEQFDLIYAGAQKNMGPAGATLVVVKESILKKEKGSLPAMLDYQAHIKGESMYNTPSVFAVYVSMLTLDWLDRQGGIAQIEPKNREKGRVMYEAIDKSELFEGYAHAKDRSLMNATFNLNRPELTDRFNELLREAEIEGLAGHRSVGGYRASMYNALPLSSVQALTEVMGYLEQKG